MRLPPLRPLVLLVALVCPARVRAQEAAAPAAPAASVVIDSTRPFTVIERRANQVRGWNVALPPVYVVTEQWEPACVAPCSVLLDPNGVYRVGGGGVAPSSPFVLPQPGPVHLHVHAGSRFWHDAGLGTFVLGAVTMLVGGIVAGSAPTQSDAHEAALTGLKIAAPGLVLLVAGAFVWLTSGSVVTSEDGRSL